MTERLALSISEAAEALGISRRFMYNVINIEGFPIVPLGGRRVIPVDLLREWMREQAKKGAGND